MATQPKYRRVEEYIKQQIHSGRLKAGDQIMTEEQLRTVFPYSPVTINKALSSLSQAGYLERIPGKGSFVSNPPHKNKQIQSPSSFSEDMLSIGLEPGTELISYRLVKGSDEPGISELLEIGPSDFMHYFVRLRTGGGTPIAISYTYLDVHTLPALDVGRLSGSLYSYLEQEGIKPQIKSQRFSASLPTMEQKSLLGVEDSALLRVTSLMYTEVDQTKKIFEHTTTYYIGDMYSYLLEPETAQLSIQSKVR